MSLEERLKLGKEAKESLANHKANHDVKDNTPITTMKPMDLFQLYMTIWLP